MLSNKPFEVILGNAKSREMKRTPSGNYIESAGDRINKVRTRCWLGIADTTRKHRNTEITETILEKDPSKLTKDFRVWRLQPNTSKTEITCYHLNNSMANRELRVHLEHALLTHSRFPKYLAVNLNRTLSWESETIFYRNYVIPEGILHLHQATHSMWTSCISQAL